MSASPAHVHPPTPEPTPTHERLREVAADLFGRRGYDGTSMSEIAAGVGIRKASLYNYYDSKEQLLLDLLDQSLAAWRQASGPALEGAGSLESRLAAHLRAAVEFAARHPEKVSIIRLAATQIGGDLGRRVRQLLSSHREEYVTGLKEQFAGALAAGELPGGDPLDLALAVRVFVDGLLSNLIFRAPDAGRFARRLPQLWAFLWRGLSGRLPAQEEA